MNFGIWTAMLAIAAGMASKDYTASNSARWLVAGGAAVVALVHLVWNMKIAQLLENDRWLARDYCEEAERMVRANYEPPSARQHPQRPRTVRLDWGTGVGWLVTLMLAAMAIAAALGGMK